MSKWELGQSLPDVALLPRIAAYFRLTLDGLFDYRPQMGEDELRSIYFGLLREFSEDPAAAYEHMEALVADYYSYWPFLQQMAALYFTRIAVEPGRKDELAARVMALLDRIPHLASSDPRTADAAELQFAPVDFKGQYKLAVTTSDAWAAYADDPSIAPLIKRLEDL